MGLDSKSIFESTGMIEVPELSTTIRPVAFVSAIPATESQSSCLAAANHRKDSSPVSSSRSMAVRAISSDCDVARVFGFKPVRTARTLNWRRRITGAARGGDETSPTGGLGRFAAEQRQLPITIPCQQDRDVACSQFGGKDDAADRVTCLKHGHDRAELGEPRVNELTAAVNRIHDPYPATGVGFGEGVRAFFGDYPCAWIITVQCVNNQFRTARSASHKSVPSDFLEVAIDARCVRYQRITGSTLSTISVHSSIQP